MKKCFERACLECDGARALLAISFYNSKPKKGDIVELRSFNKLFLFAEYEPTLVYFHGWCILRSTPSHSRIDGGIRGHFKPCNCKVIRRNK